MRRAVVWMLAGGFVALGVVGAFQLWLPTIASQALATLHTLEPASWPGAIGHWITTASKDELTSIAAGIGVVIAILALLVNARAQRGAERTARWNSTRDVLWSYRDRWEKIAEERKKAKALLKVMPPATYVYNADLTEFLDFFESMAFFGNRGHLDNEMAWSTYFDDAAYLWNGSVGYVKWRREQKKDWTLFCEYEKWIHKLAEIDSRERKRAKRRRQDPTGVPTAEDEKSGSQQNPKSSSDSTGSTAQEP